MNTMFSGPICVFIVSVFSVFLVSDADATQLQPDSLYTRCARKDTPVGLQPVTTYCQIAKEICNPASGRCESAPSQQNGDLVLWLQCREELKTNDGPLHETCKNLLKLLENKEGDDNDACPDDKWKYRLVVVIVNCAIGVTFIAMAFCWFKGWICLKKGRSTEDKLFTVQLEEDAQASGQSKTATEKESSQSTISFLDNFWKSSNVQAAQDINTAKLNDIVVKGLEKGSHDTVSHNLNNQKADYKC